MTRSNPLLSNEGRFYPDEEYVEIRQKTGGYCFKVGCFLFKVYLVDTGSEIGWGWEVWCNQNLWHHWNKGDYDERGELVYECKLAPTRKAALKKCLMGARRSAQEDIKAINYVLRRDYD